MPYQTRNKIYAYGKLVPDVPANVAPRTKRPFTLRRKRRQLPIVDSQVIFPDEIILNIASNVDDSTWFAFMLTCRTFYHVSRPVFIENLRDVGMLRRMVGQGNTELIKHILNTKTTFMEHDIKLNYIITYAIYLDKAEYLDIGATTEDFEYGRYDEPFPGLDQKYVQSLFSSILNAPQPNCIRYLSKYTGMCKMLTRDNIKNISSMVIKHAENGTLTESTAYAVATLFTKKIILDDTDEYNLETALRHILDSLIKSDEPGMIRRILSDFQFIFGGCKFNEDNTFTRLIKYAESDDTILALTVFHNSISVSVQKQALDHLATNHAENFARFCATVATSQQLMLRYTTSPIITLVEHKNYKGLESLIKANLIDYYAMPRIVKLLLQDNKFTLTELLLRTNLSDTYSRNSFMQECRGYLTKTDSDYVYQLLKTLPVE